MSLSPLFKTLSWLLISEEGTPGSFTEPQGPTESADFAPAVPLISCLLFGRSHFTPATLASLLFE